MTDTIPHIYDCPISEPTRFQFVNVDSLSEREQESLMEFVKDRAIPIVDKFERIVYTWDYFEWLRGWEKQLKDEKRMAKTTGSINKLGVGYCGACGKLTPFDMEDGKWSCRKCGYRSFRIYKA